MVSFYVKTLGHGYYYEIFELVKNILPQSNVKEVKDEKVDISRHSFLLESILIKEVSPKTITKLYTPADIFMCVSELYYRSKEDDIQYKKELKRLVKTGVIEVMKRTFPERNFDWGILTGMRPTKIVHEMLDKKYGKQKIISSLITHYKLNKSKAELLLEIALSQRKVLKNNSENKVSVYIGIPFCPSKCLYCSFPSFSIKKWGHLEDEFVENLIKEIEAIGSFLLKNNVKSETVYLGGGTPTSISLKNMEKILKNIRLYFADNKEFTVEAGRPNTLDREMMSLMKDYGVTRISINPQTMNDKTLRIIGRKHTSEDVIKAFYKARDTGFDNINMDLIIGLPGESLKDFRKSLNKVITLKPENITVHTLAIKRASELNKKLGEIELPKTKTVNAIMDFALQCLRDNGYLPYYLYRQKKMLGNLENIGFCLPGKACVYNVQIIEERQTIIGLGVGGVTKALDVETLEFNRIPNVKDIMNYNRRIDEMILRKLENPILQKTLAKQQ